LSIGAYRQLSEKTNYPLHVGITEAGSFLPGTIKSSIGFGSLLLDLELVKAVQPNFLMVFAKKLPLKPQPMIINLFLLLSELAELFMRC